MDKGEIETVEVTDSQQAGEVLCLWRARIGAVEKVDATHEKPEGLQVTTFFVTTAQGNRFVLKNVLGKPNALRLDSEYRLLQYLHEWGTPVAVPVLADDGQLFIENEHGIYLLYPGLPTDEADAPHVEPLKPRYGMLSCELNIGTWFTATIHR